MRRRGREGLVSFLAVFMLALVVAAVGLISMASNTLHNDCQRMLLDARQRDLQASGLAWAASHPERLADEGPATQGITLDLSGLAEGEAELVVRVAIDVSGGEWLDVESGCRLGNRRMERTRRYVRPGGAEGLDGSESP